MLENKPKLDLKVEESIANPTTVRSLEIEIPDPPRYRSDKLNVASNMVPQIEPRYAGFWRRTLALVIDETLLVLMQLPFLGLICSSTIYDDWRWFFLSSGLFLLIIGAFVQYWLYAACFENSLLQATPGKYLLGLKVTDLEGQPISFWRASLRLLVQYVALFTLTAIIIIPLYIITNLVFKSEATLPSAAGSIPAMLIGFCYVLFNKRRQTLFDLVSKRLVVFRTDYPDTGSLNLIGKSEVTLKSIPGSLKSMLKQTAQMRHAWLRYAYVALFLGVIGVVTFAIGSAILVVVDTEAKLDRGQAINQTAQPKPVVLYNYLARVCPSGELKAHLYDRLVKIGGDSPALILNRADYYREQKQYKLAEVDYQKALKLNAHDDYGYYDRHTFLSSVMVLKQEEGDEKAALSYALETLKVNPYNEQALNFVADLKREGKFDTSAVDVAGLQKLVSTQEYNAGFDEAPTDDEESAKEKLKECDQVIAAYRDCTKAYLVKASALNTLKKHKQALQLAQKAVATAPKDADVKLAYVDILIDQEKYVEAEKVLRQLVKSNHLAKIHNRYGQLLVLMDKPQKAIEEFSKAIKLNPDCVDYTGDRGDCYSRLENYDLAVKDYDKAIENSKRSIRNFPRQFYREKAQALASSGKPDEAMKCLDEFCQVDPKNGYNSKASYLMELKRYDEAADCYTREITLRESLDRPQLALMGANKNVQAIVTNSMNLVNTGLYAERANAFKKAGKLQEAIKDFEKAIQLGGANELYSAQILELKQSMKVH